VDIREKKGYTNSVATIAIMAADATISLKEELSMSLTLPRHNVRETRDRYSQVHTIAALGHEVITINSADKNSEVSHLNKAILDVWAKYMPVTIEEEFDAELKVWTVTIAEIDVYGEGETKAMAIEDLLVSTIDYLEVYYDRIDLYARYDPAEKKAVVAKLARCEGDKEKLRLMLGV
jgi:hypothetical protein